MDGFESDWRSSEGLNVMNTMKIPTSLRLFEYLMLKERSKNSSVVLNKQDWQVVAELGLTLGTDKISITNISRTACSEHPAGCWDSSRK